MIKKFYLILLASLFLISFTLAAVSEPSYCCEKLADSEGTCINAPLTDCNEDYKTSPTSCESTSYCKQGTCYDSKEGICMDNTPQTTCESNGGTWDEREAAEIPQCQLGCCVIADQAAFVPLVRCKRLSSLFGVTTDYRSNIFSEVMCIATAQSQDMGACVYEEEFTNTCKFTTRADCDAQEQVEVINKTEVISTEKKFYKDYLCSAEELSTDCARQISTTCYQGNVYWEDSCGNRENVYSSNKDKSWNNGKVLDADEVCDPSDGTDKDCGNCDYLLGARCGESSNPLQEDYVCKRTTCKDRNGDERMNGESWCVHPAEESAKTDAVGSRYYKEVCIDGEVIVEPCADFRNEICLQDSIETSDGEFSSAACRVNRWQDCIQQTEIGDCNNSDKRDCQWYPITDVIASRTEGICVPDFAPGFDFWQEGDATSICAQADGSCVVTYTKGLLDSDYKCEDNCDCLETDWALSANKICSSLGDCGAGINYKGEYTDDGYLWKSAEKDDPHLDTTYFSPSGRAEIASGMTGFATAPAYMVNDNLKLNSEDYVYVKA